MPEPVEDRLRFEQTADRDRTTDRRDVGLSFDGLDVRNAITTCVDFTDLHGELL
jgi:hypothetical protein